MPFLAFGGLVGSKTSALNCFEFAKVSLEFFRVMHGCNFVVLSFWKIFGSFHLKFVVLIKSIFQNSQSSKR